MKIKITYCKRYAQGGFFGLGSSESSQSTKINQNQVSVQGGGEGSFTGATGGGNSIGKKGTLVQNVAITTTADPEVIRAASDAITGALQFGAEVETSVSQQSGLAYQTINALAGQLTGQGSQVNPQTGDISTPAAGSGFDLSKWVNLALIAGGVASVLALIKSKGKTA